MTAGHPLGCSQPRTTRVRQLLSSNLTAVTNGNRLDSTSMSVCRTPPLGKLIGQTI